MCLQGFSPADAPLFNTLVTSLSKCLAHQASISASYTAFIGLERRQFYFSHLPAYFTDVHKRAMMAAPLVCADSLFLESDILRLLSDTQTSSSLQSQQALVNVASNRSGPRRCRFSPARSPSRRRRRESGSPSHSSKRVRFDSPAPSALKPPNGFSEIGAMSLVSQGRGVSMGSRCYGSPGSQLCVSGPFSFATPSLSFSDPPSQLPPQFHQGAGFVGCSVRLGGEGGHRDRASFPWVLQSPLCHSQSHRGLATGHRSLTPQRLGGYLQFPHGDCSVCSPISPSGGLDGVPGSPGCLPLGSGSSSFSLLPEVLRGGCGVSVSGLVLQPLFGPSGVHLRHGSCLVNYASPRISGSALPRRLVSPGLHLPGTSASEGLLPLAVLSPRHHSQSFEELFGPDSDSG